MHISPWFSAIDPSKSAELRLFCLPHAGGGTAAYHRWKRLLPKSIELVAIKLPGREDRLDEPLYQNLDSLAAKIRLELEPLLDRPFAFFGHSMGAAIAYRTTVHLARAQLALPTGLFASACRSPALERIAPSLHHLETKEMLHRLINRHGTSSGSNVQTSGELELMQLMANTIRADLKMLETYEHDNAAPLECDIFAFGGTDDPQVPRGELQRWQDLTAAKFSTRTFPGHHFYLRKQESAVVKTIISKLPVTR